jgi:hypothetical protein
MIEPKDHNGHRGVLGQPHRLQRWTEPVEPLSQGQTQQPTRDAQIQTHRARLTQQGATVTEYVITLTLRSKQLLWAVGLLGVLMLGFCVGLGWEVGHLHAQGYARALGSLDAIVTQTWRTLPQAAQEQLSATYGHLGLVPPGQRQSR